MLNALRTELETYLESIPADVTVVSELEFRIKHHGVREFDVFHQLAEHFRAVSSAQLDQKILTVSLDQPDGSTHRVRISEDARSDLVAMRNFCISDRVDLEYSELVSKRRLVKPYDNDQYGFRISACKEQELSPEQKQEVRDRLREDRKNPLSASDKHYRFLRRYSFLLGALADTESQIRVDLSLVKAHKGVDFRNSRVLDQRETFEVELEVTNLNIGSGSAQRREVAGLLVDQLDPIFTDMVRISLGGVALAQATDISQARSQYLKLVGAGPKRQFVGANIVALEHRDLLKQDDGSRTISPETHVVVDKTDGERHLLFGTSEGQLFLVNKKLMFKPTGLTVPALADSLLDGELLHQAGRYYYLAFDLLYLNGRDQRKADFYVPAEIGSQTSTTKGGKTQTVVHNRFSALNLDVSANSSRYGKLLALLDSQPSHDNFLVLAKQFYQYNAFFKRVATSSGTVEVVNPSNVSAIRKQMPLTEGEPLVYNVDGLILQPMTGASSHYPSYGIWEQAKKWKYTQGITIDFRVSWSQLKVIKLANTPLASAPELDRDSYAVPVKLYYLDQSSGEVAFTKLHETWYFQSDKHGQILASDDGKLVQNGDIVECKWNDVWKHWSPMRVRYDKTIPNVARTVLSNWNLLQLPLHFEHLVTPDSFQSYWSSTSAGLMENLRQTHREIKFDLLTTYLHKVRAGRGTSSDPIRVLDLGVGKANDIHRWHRLVQDRLLDQVVGVDSNLPALAEGRNRVNRTQRKSSLQVSLVQGNFTRPFIHQSSTNTVDITTKFDLVTAFFSVHYALGSEHNFRNLCYNVTTSLVDGGYFIGTSFDRARVVDLFKQRMATRSARTEVDDKRGYSVLGTTNPEAQTLVGNRLIKGETTPIWKLVLPTGQSPRDMFGFQLDVNVQSINNTHTEYLGQWTIDPVGEAGPNTRLRNIAREYGLELDYEATVGFDRRREALAEGLPSLNPVEEIFSDLNHTFVFTKSRDPANLPQLFQKWGRLETVSTKEIGTKAKPKTSKPTRKVPTRAVPTRAVPKPKARAVIARPVATGTAVPKPRVVLRRPKT